MIVRLVTFLLVSTGLVRPAENPVEIRILANTRASTIQKEFQTAGDLGYSYGGKEVLSILRKEVQY